MLNKSIITLTTALVLGCTSVAFAYEDPENRLGDRYPFLEQVYQPISASRYTGRYVTPRQVGVHVRAGWRPPCKRHLQVCSLRRSAYNFGS